jgi:hypothetical protein
MPGRNVQRKPGTARGSPRRSRTAKASRISRHAVKSRCARERDGWGRLSDDGPGHYNPDPSEDPWGGGLLTLQAVHDRVLRPDSVRDHRSDHEMHEGRRQTSRPSAHAGSRLKLNDELGRPRLTSQPSSRTGENPPYGMIGGIEETSASFEARSAPRSYPTERLGVKFPGPTRQTRSFADVGSMSGSPPEAVVERTSADGRDVPVSD